MSDPSDEIRIWLDRQLRKHGPGAAKALANALRVSRCAISRMRNRDGTKQTRRIEAHMIPVMVAFFGSVPPGFEFMRPLDPSQFYFGA